LDPAEIIMARLKEAVLMPAARFTPSPQMDQSGCSILSADKIITP
jgi:hypothetical protein